MLMMDSKGTNMNSPTHRKIIRKKEQEASQSVWPPWDRYSSNQIDNERCSRSPQSEHSNAMRSRCSLEELVFCLVFFAPVWFGVVSRFESLPLELANSLAQSLFIESSRPSGAFVHQAFRPVLIVGFFRAGDAIGEFLFCCREGADWIPRKSV